MTDLTAQVLPLTPFPVVELVVDDPPADVTVTITRSPFGAVPGGVVRGTPRHIDANGAWVGFDNEAPFGTPLSYTAVLTDPAGGAVTEILTATVPAGITAPPGIGMVVSDPLSERAIGVVVVDETQASTDSRSVRVDIAGRREPVYLLGVRSSWQWGLRLLTLTPTDHDTLDTLTASAAPILLRPASDACWLHQGYAVVEELTVTRLAVKAADTRRYWDLSVVAINGPDSTIESSIVSLQDYHLWVPTTLEDLSVRATTLLGLSLEVIAWVGAGGA